MYCNNCGKEIPKDSSFCPKCGCKCQSKSEDFGYKKNSPHFWEYIIILVVVLVCFAIGINLYFSKGTKQQTTPTQYSPTPTTNQYYPTSTTTRYNQNSQSVSGEIIKVITPNGGEKLCFGEPYTIKWESKEIELVTLSVLEFEANSKGEYFIDTVLAKDGNFLWQKAGYTRGNTNLGQGYFKIKIQSADGRAYDISDSFFSIVECQKN